MSTEESNTDGMTANEARAFMAGAASVTTSVSQRAEFAGRAGVSMYDGHRNLWDALGYKRKLTYRDYRDWYDRGDIAKPIVDKPAETTWSERPELDDRPDADREGGGTGTGTDGDDQDPTRFQADVDALFEATDETSLDRGIAHYFERADKLGRLGEYSVLYLGLADADTPRDLATPVDTSALSGIDDLLYVTPLSQEDAEVHTWVTDVTDRRNGLPETYKLDLANGDRTDTHIVHHSRVIHIAEGVLDDDINGEPALRAVMNRLFDLQKIAGAAGEAFWMTANPGLALSVDPSLKDVPTDKMDEQVDEYEHNLRRVMKLYGVDIEQLQGRDVDPSSAIDAIMSLIAGTIEVPKRKLMGSERGELASSQDESNYLAMISARQESFAEPVMLRPFIDRLVEFGIISAPRNGVYVVNWPNLFQLTELEEAELKSALADAVAKLAPMGDVELLHSLEALREFSPIDEPEGAPPPEETDDIDDDIDEDDDEVQDQFDEMTGNSDPDGDGDGDGDGDRAHPIALADGGDGD